jgi:hypothetical protein
MDIETDGGGRTAAHRPQSTRPSLYTQDERRRQDASAWTLEQGVFAPRRFLVFAVSLVLALAACAAWLINATRDMLLPRAARLEGTRAGATTGQVEPWVYPQLTETSMLDPEMRDRLARLNPAASAKVANRLLEDRLEGTFEGSAA